MISHVPLRWALWSGYYWKDLFHLQKLSIDDANFGQKWWRQKWKAKARQGLHNRIAKLENKSSKYKFLFKKLQQLHGYIRYWICLTMTICLTILFSVMIWSLCWTLFFKNSIDVRQWILLVSPGKSLLPHPSPKFPQFILPLLLLQSSRTPELTMANLIPGSQKMACQLGS